jgi:CRP/FNR family transcriptional regulator
MQTEFDSLPELQRLPVLSFSDGQRVFDETRACLGFPLVDQGSIKVFKSFANGRELLLYLVGPGEACVVSANSLFMNRPYGASAAARGDVRLRVIPPQRFDALMGEVSFRRLVMAQFAQRMGDLMALVDAVVGHQLDQRLAQRLLAHRAEQGEAFALTHQQLADELGSIREVVSRLLKQFADKGWIALERGSIRVVDAQGLQSVGGCVAGARG